MGMPKRLSPHPRAHRRFAVFWTMLFLVSLAVPAAALALTGAVFTSNADGSEVNLNIYDSKAAVYLTGGPCQGGSHLADGQYYFEVSSPSGDLLSSDSIGDRLFTVEDGFIVSTTSHVTHDVACTSGDGITVQLLPYADTPNPGGEYKLTLATKESVEACAGFDAASTTFQICDKSDGKSDNFKVGPNGNLKVVKDVDGGQLESGFRHPYRLRRGRRIRPDDHVPGSGLRDHPESRRRSRMHGHRDRHVESTGEFRVGHGDDHRQPRDDQG